MAQASLLGTAAARNNSVADNTAHIEEPREAGIAARVQAAVQQKIMKQTISTPRRFSQGRTMLRRRRVNGNGSQANDFCYRSG